MLFLFLAGSVHGQTNLTRGVPATVALSPTNYAISIQQNCWNVVGISPNGTVNDDWDINHGSAQSWYANNAADYVLANGNLGTLTGNTGTVQIWSSTNTCVLVHAGNGSTISPGGSAMYSWTTNDIIYFFEILISTAGQYNIGVTGSNTLKYELFTPGSGVAWFDRSSCHLSSTVGTSSTNLSLSAGMHCLVVFKDGGAGIATTLTASCNWNGTPNLLAASVSVPGAPVTVSAGNSFSVTRVIQNVGTAAGATSFGIYLSTDSTISTSDTLLYTGATGSVNPSTSSTVTISCTVPASTPNGQYYVGLYIAPSNTACTATRDVTVVSPFTPVAQSVSVVGAPVTVLTGGTFQVTRAIQNSGGVSGSATYVLYLSPDATIDAGDTQVYSGATPAITPGSTDTATDTCTAPASMSPGTYYAGLFLSATNTAVTSTPDVTVQLPPFNAVARSVQAVGAPLLVNPGNTFSVARSIQNTGGLVGSTAYSIYLSADANIDTGDILVFSGTTGSISPGTTETITDTCTAPGTPGGPYYVGLFIAVGNGACTSTPEVTVGTFTPVAQAISVIGALFTVPLGGSFQVSRSIQNAGTAASTTPYSVYLSPDNAISMDDIQVLSTLSGSISAGGTDTAINTCFVPFSTAAGTYFVILYVAAGNTACTSSADVSVIVLTINASSIEPVNTPVRVPVGSNFQAQRTFTNNDTLSGRASYQVYLSQDTVISVSDILVHTGITGLIAPGTADTAIVTCTVPVVALPDTDYFVGLLLGAAETACSTETVHTLPNFARFDAVAVILPGSLTRVPGQTVDVQIQIRNTGGVSGNTNYTLYLSPDTDITTSDWELTSRTSSDLPPDGGQETVPLTVTIPQWCVDGTHHIGLYLNAAFVSNQTACSIGLTVLTPQPASTALGCAAPYGALNSSPLGSLLPLVLLGVACALVRRYRGNAPPNRANAGRAPLR